MIRVLYFANIPVENLERSIGGATVLAKKILGHISKDERIVVKHLQIRSFWKYKLQLLDYTKWVFTFPFYLKSIDVVSFHGTKDYHFTVAPVLWLWAKILGKKTSYHFFGGNFHEQYLRSSWPIKLIFKKTILSSDTVFFETIEMLKFFEKENVSNGVWLPNSREPIPDVLPKIDFKRKFVFISRIIPQKGIKEIINTAGKLSSEYSMDVYGPIDDRHYGLDLFQNSKVNYKGILKPQEVNATLAKYDVLLLPSYFDGEGYPGIIIEALSMAIPIIATKWKALPEIITNEFNGILIDIKNEDQLEKAILGLNETNYQQYSRNALQSFQNFNSEIVFNKIIERYIL